MKSKVYKLDGRLFRYDFDNAVVEYIVKADNEYLKDNEEWLQKYGRPLFDIDHDGYIVLDSIGLSLENWQDREARNGYLESWAMDLDEEESRLGEDFIRYELPYLV